MKYLLRTSQSTKKGMPVEVCEWYSDAKSYGGNPLRTLVARSPQGTPTNTFVKADTTAVPAAVLFQQSLSTLFSKFHVTDNSADLVLSTPLGPGFPFSL